MNASDVLPAQFNVSSWFVDKNVAEGRGASPAFLHEDRTLTYADVQELVNRTGNALLELGVEMETRVLMLCLDAPEFIGTFWGAIRSEEHTSELQSRLHLVCRLLLEKKKYV